MGYWQYKDSASDAWSYLDDEVKPDVALLQETVPPVDDAGFIGKAEPPSQGISDASTYLWRRIGDKRKWGSGVFTKGLPVRELWWNNSYPGWVVAGEVLLPNDRLLTVVSLHAKIEYSYSITTLHRMLSDLTLILDGKLGKRLIILGGDFNASLQWDDQQAGESHRILFERIRNFGLSDCIAKFHDGFVRTWRREGVDKPWQLDHLFISEDSLEKLVSCMVIDEPRVHALSDHNPIVADLEV